MPQDTVDEVKDKAAQDSGAAKAGDFDAMAGQKVQLDIDDAPFLVEPEEEPAVPAVTENSLPEPVEQKKRKVSKKLIVIALVVLLAIIGAAVWFFMFRTPPPPPPQPEVIVVPTPKAPAGPREFVTTMAPFWVPLTDDEGKSRFLVATFVLSTVDDPVNQEIQDNLVTLRDAIYYYLSNKDYHFLIDAANAETIRADLLGTINNYIVRGELRNLYFDSYLMQ